MKIAMNPPFLAERLSDGTAGSRRERDGVAVGRGSLRPVGGAPTASVLGPWTRNLRRRFSCFLLGIG
jgi:hypothetical protein